MRHVTRPNVSEKFLERAQKEFDRVIAHRDSNKTGSFTFRAYKHDEVKALLHDLFHGKCAYCETYYAQNQPMDVEHFRPKGAVAEDEDHPGYWWLAMKWDNLLPSCTDCNRKRKQVVPKGAVKQVELQSGGRFSNSERRNAGKKDSFPILAGVPRAADRTSKADRNKARSQLANLSSPELEDEKALLLNPCVEDPLEHLTYHFGFPEDAGGPSDTSSVSFVLAKQPSEDEHADFRGDDGLSLKGAVSIHVYGLNRLDLVQARTEVLRRLEFLKSIGIRLFTLSQDLGAAAKKQPDGGELRELLERSARTARNLGQDTIQEIARMAEDHQPFCSMVNAWRDQFESEIKARLTQGG